MPCRYAEKAYILNEGKYCDSLKLATSWTLEASTKYNNKDILVEMQSSLEDNIMPDFTGIKLEDAIFILENRGFQVKFNGYGHVAAQSITPGSEIKNENNITLTLR